MNDATKAVMIVFDGLGDRAVPSLGGKTPLEVSHHPNLDRLISRGQAGLMDPLSPGIRVSTDVGHLALFGHNPLQVYWGRGPVEAAGLKLVMKPSDVALRCNFATVDEDLTIVDRRAGRIRRDAESLAETIGRMELPDGVEASFYSATEHRGVLILRGCDLSSEITPSDPGPGDPKAKVLPVEARDPNFAFARRTAQAVSQFVAPARPLLATHPTNQSRIDRGLLPANYILTRGAGMQVSVRSFRERFGISGACIAGESTILGVARITGLKAITDSEFTGNLDTNVEKKVQCAMEALQDNDLVVIHFKATDICGHDNLPDKKAEFIARVDLALGRLVEYAEERGAVYFAAASDHSTPCMVGEHTADPVPVFVSGRDTIADAATHYCERECASGALGRITANDFLLTVLDYLDKTYRYGD